MLHKQYATNYPQTFEGNLPEEVVYIGKHKLTDPIEVEGHTTNIGKLILSPTRTYAPVVKKLLEHCFADIHGLIHCSGGGQTKCMKYLPGNMRIVKDNLFNPPLIFNIIQQASNLDYREMYQVFNMGHRLEIFTTAEKADEMVSIANSFNIEAKVVGRVEPCDKKELILKGNFGEIYY